MVTTTALKQTAGDRCELARRSHFDLEVFLSRDLQNSLKIQRDWHLTGH
jgi:hypothetical protein